MIPSRRLSIILVLLLCAIALHAAEVDLGFEGGLNFNIIDTSTRWAYTSWDNSVAGDAALSLKVQFTDRIALSTGARYIVRSAYYTKEYDSSVVDSYMVLHQFLEFPLTLQLYTGNSKCRVFLGFGGYAGVRICETHIGSSQSLMNGSESFASNVELNSSDNRFDGGLIAEAGLTCPLSKGEFYIRVRYQYSLTSLAKDTQSDVTHTYIDTVSITAGYLFALGGRK